MVQTRRQWRDWIDHGGNDSQPCESCANDQAFSEGGEDNSNENVHDNAYRRNDHCHRHRKQDNTPKTEHVIAYSRRKPK